MTALIKKSILAFIFIGITCNALSQEKKKASEIIAYPPAYNPEIKKEIQEVIVDGIDWYSYPKDNQESAFSAVGYLKIPSKYSRCTTFIVSENLILTNNHCISNVGHMEDAQLIMDYEESSEYTQSYRCVELIATNEELDYSLIRVEGNPGRTHGIIQFNENKVLLRGDEILIIHQNCDYYTDNDCVPFKKLSEGKITYNHNDENTYYYNADTLGGSSGSPVLYWNSQKNEYQLIALHNHGYGDPDADGRGSYNSGNSSSAIYAQIGSYLDDYSKIDAINSNLKNQPVVKSDPVDLNKKVVKPTQPSVKKPVSTPRKKRGDVYKVRKAKYDKHVTNQLGLPYSPLYFQNNTGRNIMLHIYYFDETYGEYKIYTTYLDENQTQPEFILGTYRSDYYWHASTTSYSGSYKWDGNRDVRIEIDGEDIGFNHERINSIGEEELIVLSIN